VTAVSAAVEVCEISLSDARWGAVKSASNSTTFRSNVFKSALELFRHAGNLLS
jgi:hypothetical protein